MEWIVGAVVVLVLLIAKAYWDEREYRKTTLRSLKKEWGQWREERASYEKMQTMGSYYQTVRDEESDVDDTTWNDLELEELYHRLNHTESAMGEEYLYAALRKPLFEGSELKERNRLACFFMEHEEERMRVQTALRRMGKLKDISLYEYVNKTITINHDDTLKHILYDAALLSALGLTFFVSSLFGFALFFCLAANIVTYYKRKAEIEKYYSFLAGVLRILGGIDKMVKLDVKELRAYWEDLLKAKRAFRKFRRGSFLIFSGGNGSESIADFVMNYLQMLLHFDLMKFNAMIGEVGKNREALNGIFVTIGSLDLGVAIASFRAHMGDSYCLPRLTDGVEPFLEVEDVFHPLLEEPVCNSILQNKNTLLTGSNASGKSTFLKTLAINAILAQTLYTAPCSRYHASYFKVFTSMALRDDLFHKESYFIVEIKSLKRIMDHMGDGAPMLCMVDEVLRGTNTLERIASSSQILKHIASCNALCFAATHDVELTYVLEGVYDNYHFTERIADGEVLFDYRLYEGRATSRNAIQLLGVIGYDKELIRRASEEANYFLKEGKWRSL